MIRVDSRAAPSSSYESEQDEESESEQDEESESATS